MSRRCLLLVLALLSPACAAPPARPTHLHDTSAAAGGAGGGAGGGSAPVAMPEAQACALAGHEDAPAGISECGSETTCDADADCARFAGNYCQLDICSYQGCLRGRCTPNRVQGEPCSRGAECNSGVCDCVDFPSCACTPGKGATIHLK